jgi:hypothetical protein
VYRLEAENARLRVEVKTARAEGLAAGRLEVARSMLAGMGDPGWCGCQSLAPGQICGQCGYTYEEAADHNAPRSTTRGGRP